MARSAARRDAGRPADRTRARAEGRAQARPEGRGRADGRAPVRPEDTAAATRARFRAAIEPALPAGVDLEDLSVQVMGRRHLVRVTVDADGGVSHERLSDISHAVSAALDAAETAGTVLTPGAYTLEVSSPGVDRPLTLPRHWRRNVGRLVRVTVAGAGVTGRITATDAAGVTLDVDGTPRTAGWDALGPGRVQVEFSRPGEPEPEIDDEYDEDDEIDDEDDGDIDDGAGQPREQEDGA
jgi:ribosome maturation factor RimP